MIRDLGPLSERDVFDIFVSYRHSDGSIVRSLVASLQRKGLRVWFDESSIQDFGGISDAARQGLAQSKALVVYYSADYPLSAPCQWELISAFLASQRLGDPRQRVLVVNPETGPGHIEPVELRDALYQSVVAADQTQIDQVVDAIAVHLKRLDGELGDGIVLPAFWLPAQPSAAPRFVGRQREMWQIHSALHALEAGMTQGAVGPGVVQVRGLGGIGKSLLAREYALRFSAGYPGGVFLLYAQGDLAQESTETERESLRLGQLHSFAVSVLGAERSAGLAALSPIDVEAMLRNAMATSQPCLWVVDDMPVGLSATEVHRWLGPSSARTLVTTRSGEYAALMTEIALGVLQEEEALDVLRSRREPQDDEELAAARAVVTELGGHALAIDVAGGTLRFQSYEELLKHLLDPTEDELELAAELREELPTGRERSISATLSHSLDRLDQEGQDLLRLASMMARDPIPRSLFGAVLASADGKTPASARATTIRALDEAFSLSLIERVDGDSWQIHPLLARTVTLKDTDTTRQALLRRGAVSVLKESFADVTEPAARAKARGLVSHARRIVQEVTSLDEAELLGCVARYDYETGDFKTAKLGHEREVEALTELLGPRDPKTFLAMGQLAVTLRGMGDLQEARELSEEVVASTTEVLGSRHPDALAAMSVLARTLYHLGELQAGRTMAEEVLSGLRDVLGPEHPETLGAMRTLGITLCGLGDLQAARELQEQALAMFCKVLGPGHPEARRAMSQLAYTMEASGDLQAARELEEAALAGFREVLGPRHPDTFLAMNNLAYTLLLLGELQAARDLAI
jgi:tetratricopeptide (TPR) repeat protein